MSTGWSRYSKIRSKSANEVCTSSPTPSSEPTGKKSRVCSVVKATSVAIEKVCEPLASARPPNQYTAAGMTAKLVWIEAITQRPAIRWRTSRSASRCESASKRSASSSPRPIVLPSRIPETESDSCTRLEMSASVSCVVFAIRRRSWPTRLVRKAKSGISANAKSASCQLRTSMPIIVAATVVTLEAIDVAVFVTTFCTPPMSFWIRDCTSPVRVRVKNASDSRCRCRKTAARRSCITRWPTWFERSVWITPSTPVTTAIAIIPAAFHESAAVSLRPMASRTRLSRNAGKTPSPAETTLRSSTAPSRSLYGQKSHPMRRRFALRTAGSAARSGGASAEWKNMPIRPRVRRAARLMTPAADLHAHRVVPAVDVQRRRGDVLRVVREQVRGRSPHVVGLDVAVQRRALLDDRLHRQEAGDRARGQRPHRPCRYGGHPDVLLAEIPREVAHRGVERRLGDAHHVVVRHRPLAAEVRHRQDRPASARVHQRLGQPRARDERVGRDVERKPEAIARRVGEAPFEVLRGRERDRVHQDVEPAVEGLPHLVEDTREILVRADVALRHEPRADRLRQLADALLDPLALEREGKLRAALGEATRDRPGDRALVRNA